MLYERCAFLLCREKAKDEIEFQVEITGRQNIGEPSENQTKKGGTFRECGNKKAIPDLQNARELKQNDVKPCLHTLQVVGNRARVPAVVHVSPCRSTRAPGRSLI